MIDEQQVLRITRRKSRLIFYHDFDELKPPHSKGYHWLFSVKKALIANGYQCHEARCKWKWDCSYSGGYTHFHKLSL